MAGKGSVRTKPTSVAAKSFWGGIKKFHEKTVEEDGVKTVHTSPMEVAEVNLRFWENWWGPSL